MDVSIIFPVKNEGSNVRSTLDSLLACKTNVPYEIIIVDDHSEDDCCNFLADYPQAVPIKLIKTVGLGAANARNFGASHAKGKYLLFCDAHLLFHDWWIDKLIEPIQKGETEAISPAIGSIGNEQFIGFGQTLKPNLRIKWNLSMNQLTESAILPGACILIDKSTFEQVNGFERGFFTWGYEDVELSIKLWLFGYRCHVLPTVRIEHLFRKQLPYTVEYYDYYYNLLRMAYLHFDSERIQKCKKLIIFSKVEELEKKVLDNGVLNDRSIYMKKRKRNDEWFFKKFLIDF